MIRHAPRHDRIAIDLAVVLGKPLTRGIRITVEQILRELGAGMAIEEIVAAHPRLTAEDIRAAQTIAADWLAEETVSLADVAEASRQSRAIATGGYAAEDQAFIEAIAEPWSA